MAGCESLNDEGAQQAARCRILDALELLRELRNRVLSIEFEFTTSLLNALLKNDSYQPVPLAEHMEHDVLHYEQVAELQQRLKDHLRPYVQAVEP